MDVVGHASATEKPSTLSLDELSRLAGEALVKAGVPLPTAERVADVLVDAEARGIASHGLVRLPSYVARAEAGLIDPGAAPMALQSEGACALIDGRNAFGAIAATLAAQMVTERARRFGIGWATVIHSNHLGAIGYYVRQLAAQGLCAMMWSNAAPSVAAHGGKRPILGTNPIALAVPRKPAPIVLDMATSAVARGRIRRALAEGRAIPADWAMTADGHNTTDPATALAGALLPLGGAKGYGLSVFIELLSGVLGGGASLDRVFETTEVTKPADIAFTLIAVDPRRFIEPDRYAATIEDFVIRLKASGGGEILLPGEPEDRALAKARRRGVTVAPDILAQFVETGIGQ